MRSVARLGSSRWALGWLIQTPTSSQHQDLRGSLMISCVHGWRLADPIESLGAPTERASHSWVLDPIELTNPIGSVLAPVGRASYLVVELASRHSSSGCPHTVDKAFALELGGIRNPIES
jgi:hypothetical protein